MYVKSTHTFATHQIPVECDIYDSPDFPADSPVFLYFHSGGLVAGSRACVPPWLAQYCYRRKSPLISASYRLLPQAGGSGLLADAEAAYTFTLGYRAAATGDKPRKVVLAGASAGFFVATLAAVNSQPVPVALLDICGIPTFDHAWFGSSTLLTPEPLQSFTVQSFLDEPVAVGAVPPTDPSIFSVDKLLPDGSRNPAYEADPAQAMGGVAPEKEPNGQPRGMLYDYFLYRNQFPDLLRGVDHCLKSDRPWPPTVAIQTDIDPDVDFSVTQHFVETLGPNTVKLFLAHAADLGVPRGDEHHWERAMFLEDGGMGVIRAALEELDNMIG